MHISPFPAVKRTSVAQMERERKKIYGTNLTRKSGWRTKRNAPSYYRRDRKKFSVLNLRINRGRGARRVGFLSYNEIGCGKRRLHGLQA